MQKIIKIPFYIALVFIVGLLSGHLTFKLLSFNKTVVVPDINGKGLVEATDILRKKGLYIRLEGEDFDNYAPAGYIMRQDVPHGNKVKAGREIRVVLSKGPRVRYAPDVVGQPIDAAEVILRDRGIKVGRVIYVHSDTVPKNVILAQRPEPNEKGGDMFSVIVSSGAYEN